MTEPVDLPALRAALAEVPHWYDLGATTTADCWGEPPRTDGREDWCVYDTGEDDPPIAERMFRFDAQHIALAWNAVPVLVAALEEAERRLAATTTALAALFDILARGDQDIALEPARSAYERARALLAGVAPDLRTAEANPSVGNGLAPAPPTVAVMGNANGGNPVAPAPPEPEAEMWCFHCGNEGLGVVGEKCEFCGRPVASPTPPPEEP